MAAVCLDASFVLAIAFRDTHWEKAFSWWNESMVSRAECFVPPLFYPEVTSAVRRRVYLKTLSPEDAEMALTRVLRWPVTVREEDNVVLQRKAYNFAARFNRPRAYDSQYLAVAELLGCELWTADERLANAVAGHLPWVRWIGAAA